MVCSAGGVHTGREPVHPAGPACTAAAGTLTQKGEKHDLIHAVSAVPSDQPAGHLVDPFRTVFLKIKNAKREGLAGSR